MKYPIIEFIELFLSLQGRRIFLSPVFNKIQFLYLQYHFIMAEQTYLSFALRPGRLFFQTLASKKMWTCSSYCSHWATK